MSPVHLRCYPHHLSHLMNIFITLLISCLFCMQWCVSVCVCGPTTDPSREVQRGGKASAVQMQNIDKNTTSLGKEYSTFASVQTLLQTPTYNERGIYQQQNQNHHRNHLFQAILIIRHHHSGQASLDHYRGNPRYWPPPGPFSELANLS